MFNSRFATAALALFAGVTSAVPTAEAEPVAAGPFAELAKRQGGNIDVTVLQFALTLENLENAFYRGALQKFSAADFERAGYNSDYYNNLKFIAYDEQTHVQLLSGALQAAGVTPVAECSYSFPYKTVQDFITLSSVLEGVGTSAYLGGAPLITSKQYLTVAGSILAVEALHTSYQRAAINEVPMANALMTPLDPTSVYTLAAVFINSCPASNAALPFTPYPSLQLYGDTCTCEEPDCSREESWGKRSLEKRWRDKSEGWPKRNHNGENQCSPPKAGDTAIFSAATKGANLPKGLYLTYVSGLTVTSVPTFVYGNAISSWIPDGVSGQTYVFITKSDVEGTLDNTQILYGPAVLEVYPPAPALNYGY